jgi:hypothetical protein
MNGSLVLVARAGFFIPNGNSNRSHRGATLLPLLVAGEGGVDVMWESGHWCVEAITNAAYCSRRAKRDISCAGEDCVTLRWR